MMKGNNWDVPDDAEEEEDKDDGDDKDDDYDDRVLYTLFPLLLTTS